MANEKSGDIGADDGAETDVPATEAQTHGGPQEVGGSFGGSADLQDNTSSDASGSTAPDDLGSTGDDSDLTAGGTGTAYGLDQDVTSGGLPRGYGSSGTVGGGSSGEIGTTTGTQIDETKQHRR